MIKIGNHFITEILWMESRDGEDNLEYVVDQISNASLEVSSDPTEITDKNGNVVRTIYRSKTGTFNATAAMLHPALENAPSGDKIQYASQNAPIDMPKVLLVPSGGTASVSDMKTGTLRVMGLYGNGANEPMSNTDAMTHVNDGVFTAPSVTNGPVQYYLSYERADQGGARLKNRVDKFSGQSQLRLFASYGDPCENDLKPCFITIPKFIPDPSMTINFDAENQEMDFTGTCNADFCSGEKILYIIDFPDEKLVVTGTTE